MSIEREPDHPSGPTEARLAAESRHGALGRYVLGAVHFHDFVRFGNPAIIEELECYLVESGSGQHAEQLLDEIYESVQALRLNEERRP